MLVNVVLLPLMGRVRVYAAPTSFRMESLAPLVGMPDRVTREARCVGLMGRSEY